MNSINSISTSIGCIQLLFRSSCSWLLPFNLGQLTNSSTWVCRKKKRVQTMKNLSTNHHVDPFLEKFSKWFGMFWERFFGDQLPVGCTMALPEKSRLPWEPGPFLLLLLRWSTDQRCTGAVQKKRPSNSCGAETSWFSCELSKKQKFQGQTDGHLNKIRKSLGGRRIPKMD